MFTYFSTLTNQGFHIHAEFFLKKFTYITLAEVCKAQQRTPMIIIAHTGGVNENNTMVGVYSPTLKEKPSVKLMQPDLCTFCVVVSSGLKLECSLDFE